MLAFAGAARADAGSVTGTVTVVKLSVGSRSAGPEEVIVYLEDAPSTGKPPPGPFAISQIGKSFEPRVLVVPVGARVDFPNLDELFHNVFSSAPGNGFDLGMYKSGASRSHVFENPGIVPIFCNIHPQMVAYVLVVTNPFHTRAAADGSYTFTGVPPGRYTVATWSPWGRGERRPIVVAGGGQARADFVVRERAGVQEHRNKEGKPYSRY
jgi:plastocyanin